MRSSIIVSAFALVASVSAINLTFPKTKNATVDFSVSNEVTWESVSTDALTVSIHLVNNNINPPTTKLIAANVTTSDHKYTISSLSDVAIASGYQINLYKPLGPDEKAAAIATQSEQFSVSKSGSGKEADKPTKTDDAATVSETAGAPATTTSTKPNGAGALKVGGWGLVVAGLVASLL